MIAERLTERGKVTVLWSDPSLYLSDCLAASRRSNPLEVIYTTDRVLPDHADHPDTRTRTVGSSDPVRIAADAEVVLVGGWRNRAYLRAARAARRRGATVILALDTQVRENARWRWQARAFGLVLRQIFDGAFVPGDRQAAVCRLLGFGDRRIEHGLYACRDVASADGSSPGGGKGFLWVGRLVAQKDVATFIEGYAEYRRRTGASAWPGWIVGDGIDRRVVEARPVDGLEHLGHLAGEEVLATMLGSGCFVSTSTGEPWGMVIAEAAAAGLPIICTTAAGAGDHLVDAPINGVVVAPGDVDALAGAMASVSEASADRRASMAARSLELASEYSADLWPGRLWALVDRLAGMR